jgi:hypothetical protein
LDIHEKDDELAQFVRTPEYVLSHLSKSHVIARYPSDYRVEFHEFKPLDTRTTGVANYFEWREVSDPEIHDFYSTKCRPIELIEDDTTAVLSWEHDVGDPDRRGQQVAKRRIVLQKDRGYSPSRLEIYLRWPDETYGDPAATCDSEYALISGCWLPTTSFFVDKTNGINLRARVKFIWNSVNTPIDPATFTPEGLDAPGGTAVAVMSKGRPSGHSMIPPARKNNLPGIRPRVLPAQSIDTN